MTLPQSKLEILRKRHPSITYKSYHLAPRTDELTIEFEFHLAGGPIFHPKITLPTRTPVVDEKVHALAFRLGLVELLSYWKTCCPPEIIIEANVLPNEEHSFWLQLLRYGLGEFFFLNGINPNIDVSLQCSVGPSPFRADPAPYPAAAEKPCPTAQTASMVLVGGGKDSIVSLELLRAYRDSHGVPLHAFSINPIPASIAATQQACCDSFLVASRQIDPQLLHLNTQGYLNGHTPFSALVAFASTLTAYINGISHVFSSNESSANEGNVLFHGVQINHQYSKGIEFESAFRSAMKHLSVPVSYSSLLRPLNELQICSLFCSTPDYLSIFQSCNTTQTINAKQKMKASKKPPKPAWCGHCPKCIFTFLCLACFLEEGQLIDIFETLPSTRESFLETVKALAGAGEHKPFECVGTFEEVRACLQYIMHTSPSLITSDSEDVNRLKSLSDASPNHLSDLLGRWNEKHFVSPQHEAWIRQAISTVGLRDA